MEKVEPSSLVDIRSFEGGQAHHRFIEESLRQRLTIIGLLNRDDMAKVAEALGATLVDLKIDDATEWAIKFSPFKGFNLYFILQKYSPEFEDKLLVLYGKEALELGVPAEDASDFAILYANAIIYAAKKVLSKPLPRLSRYL